MSASVDHVVNDYLSRLDEAAAGLPPAQRAELFQEIREHIDAARAAGAGTDEAAVRTILDRLGDPEDIVAAALEASPPVEPALVAEQPSTGMELTAVLLLTIGSLVPFLGWAAGAVLLWGSRRWNAREKLLGTLVVPGGPGLVLWLGLLFPTRACSEIRGPRGVRATDCTGFALPPEIGVPLFLALLIAPLVVAGVLYSRARSRAEAEEPVLRPTGATSTTVWTGQELTALLLLAVGGVIALTTSRLGTVVSVAAAAVGLTLVWTSRQWDRREQRIATTLFVVSSVLAICLRVAWRIVGGFAGRIADFSFLPVGLAIGMIAASIYLTVALNSRRR